jgi:hypothetical protein
VKPLLVVSLTSEDANVWLWVTRKQRPYSMLCAHSWPADHRDAELMRHAQEIAKYGPAAIMLHGIEVRGWTTEPL